MHELSHKAGVYAALKDFALTKQAGLVGDLLSGFRTSMIGQPIEALKQIRAGTLFKPGTGLYYNGLPRSAGALAGNLAIPIALTVMAAKTNPPESRGELVGDMLGRTAGSLLGGPLAGALGQVGGGMLLSNVGRELGKRIDTVRAPRKSDVVAEE